MAAKKGYKLGQRCSGCGATLRVGNVVLNDGGQSIRLGVCRECFNRRMRDGRTKEGRRRALNDAAWRMRQKNQEWIKRRESAKKAWERRKGEKNGETL